MSDTNRPHEGTQDDNALQPDLAAQRAADELAESGEPPGDVTLPSIAASADVEGVPQETEQSWDAAAPEPEPEPEPESDVEAEVGEDAVPEGEGAEVRVMQLLEGLSSGRIAPRSLATATRRVIVEHVHSQGLTIPEIASMLHVSDRTIRRDLDAIRAANILHADPKLPNLLGGEVLSEARHSIARIRRTTREKDCPHASRIEGERAIIAIYGDMVLILQRLGLLPSAASKQLAMPAEFEFGDDAAVLIAESRRLTVLITEGALGEQPMPTEPDEAAIPTAAATPKGGSP